MVSRAVVKLVNDDGKMQLVQVKLLGLTRDDVEHFQSYGFTSVPKDGAEAVVVNVGANGDHPVVIVVNDRRYRIKGLEEGEVAVYNDQGSKIVFKKNSDIEVTTTTKVKIDSPDVELTGDVVIDGTLDVTKKATFSDDVDVSKTLTATTDVVGGGKHLKTHTHKYSDADTPSGGAGGTNIETQPPS
jgi:phage baseplate assembly protein V